MVPSIFPDNRWYFYFRKLSVIDLSEILKSPLIRSKSPAVSVSTFGVKWTNWWFSTVLRFQESDRRNIFVLRHGKTNQRYLRSTIVSGRPSDHHSVHHSSPDYKRFGEWMKLFTKTLWIIRLIAKMSRLCFWIYGDPHHAIKIRCIRAFYPLELDFTGTNQYQTPPPAPSK